MNKINDDLKFYNAYFQGFHDIYRCKSAMEVGKGIIKIASYGTILLPIIFGIGHLIAESEKNDLSNLCNRVTEKMRTHKKEINVFQEDLFKFLMTKLLDNEKDKLFGKVFSTMHPDYQVQFLLRALEIGKCEEALEQIPGGILSVDMSAIKKSLNSALLI